MSTINNPTIDNSTGDTLTTTVTQKWNIHFGIMIIAAEQKVNQPTTNFCVFRLELHRFKSTLIFRKNENSILPKDRM